MNTKADAAKSNDVLAMLTEDHARVKALFEQFAALGERAHVGKRKLADEICNELSIHATLEEELFYPAVRAAGKDNQELVDEAIVEHAAARDLIAQIRATDVRDELFDAKVKVLAEQIAHHVDEEETGIFPRARKSKLDLAELGEQAAGRKAQIGTQPA
jgi:hemerythrin-like domain-containing protein